MSTSSLFVTKTTNFERTLNILLPTTLCLMTQFAATSSFGTISFAIVKAMLLQACKHVLFPRVCFIIKNLPSLFHYQESSKSSSSKSSCSCPKCSRGRGLVGNCGTPSCAARLGCTTKATAADATSDLSFISILERKEQERKEKKRKGKERKFMASSCAHLALAHIAELSDC